MDFLRAGLGFGGFCFPNDIQAFIRLGEKTGVDVSLLKDTELNNKRRIDLFLAKATQALWTLKNKRIGILGLAFKPNTDDIRFAPALSIIRRLLAEGAHIQAYDPEAMDKARKEIPEVSYCQDMYEAADGAEAIVLLTEWEEFQKADWNRLSTLVERSLIVDGRNTLSREEVTSHGFHYVGIGGVSGAPVLLPSISN